MSNIVVSQTAALAKSLGISADAGELVAVMNARLTARRLSREKAR